MIYEFKVIRLYTYCMVYTASKTVRGGGGTPPLIHTAWCVVRGAWCVLLQRQGQQVSGVHNDGYVRALVRVP